MRILFIFRAPLVSPRSEEVTRTELGGWGKQTFCSLRLGLGTQLTRHGQASWPSGHSSLSLPYYKYNRVIVLPVRQAHSSRCPLTLTLLLV